MKGKFITIEGIEGSGKSSQVKYMMDFIEKNGKSVIYTREPGGIKLGESIRGLLLSDDYKDMHLNTETLLFLAARSENIQKLIKPVLNTGTWIVCDRFMDSTYAYQYYLKGMDYQFIKNIHAKILEGCYPDQTIILDLDVSQALDRISTRKDNNRFDKMDHSMHEKIRDGYLQIARLNPDRVTVVNAAWSVDKVSSSIEPYLLKLLKTN